MKIAEYCFEEFCCKSVAWVKQASLHLYSELRYNGIVVDLGAGLTQITPVSDGYSSSLSSQLYKVTGNVLDDYLYKMLYAKFNPDANNLNVSTIEPPSLSFLNLYKIKNDLKQTAMSPYSIPFNYEILKVK